MFGKVTKGKGMVGLLRYLVGPGKREEHVSPHLVAGSELLVAVHGEEAHLSRRAATEIAAWIDSPRRMFGTVITVPDTRVDPETGDKVVVGRKEQHVWHCALAVKAEEGALGDERWRAVAQDFAAAMGFSEASGKAPCRWVAVHHGPSVDGNDHVHFVASMVREDGTRWDRLRDDYKTVKATCRDLEVRHGLLRLDSEAQGVGERGVEPAEVRRALAAGLDPVEQTAPRELALRIRAHASASTSEAEFVRRARADGIVIKPRYAKDSTTHIDGYKVALPASQNGGEWRFHAGGKLARDLSLPQLRKAWPTPDETGRAAAVAEWRAAHAGAPAVEAAGRERVAVAAAAGTTATERLGAFNRSLATLDHGDTAGWARAARQGAGALAAASRTAEREQALALARAARVLARTARAVQPPGMAPAGRDSAMGAALVLLNRGRGAVGVEAKLHRELLTTARAVQEHHRVVGHHGEAARIETALAPLQAIGLAAVTGQGVARAAARVVGAQADPEYRGWEDERERGRGEGLER